MSLYKTNVYNQPCNIEYHQDEIEDSNPIVIDKIMFGDKDILPDISRQKQMWIEESIFDSINKK